MYGRGVPQWFESPIQPAITHQLSGLGSPNQLEVDMPDGSYKLFFGITTDLDAALKAGGRPKRPDLVIGGNVTPQGYYVLTTFEGGWLLDGCPLNVIFGQGWLPGQQEALQSAGIFPSCPQVQPMQQVTPTQTVQTLPFPSPTGTTINAPVFTPTLTTGGLVTSFTPIAPGQTVYSPQAPPLAVQPYDMGAPAPGQPGAAGAGLPSWVPIAAVALIAAVLLRGRGK